MVSKVIRGLGPVTPAGIGAKAFGDALAGEKNSLGKLTRFPFGHEVLCGEIDGPSLDAHVRDRRFRRAAPITRYALAATALALSDSGEDVTAGSDTALVMGLTHGALGYTQLFHRALITEGVSAASPIHFSDSVLNAPAGNVSICFGIKGPAHTLVGGPDAAIKATMLACRLLDEGTIRRVVVISAEELNELSLSSYERLGEGPLAEGAGAFVVERGEGTAPGAPYCRIAGAAAECCPDAPEDALRNAVDRALAMAEIGKEAVDLVMTDSGARVRKLLPGKQVAGISSLTGRAFAAGVMWDVLAAAMKIKDGALAGRIAGDRLSGPVRNVVVCTCDVRGTAAAMLLSPAEGSGR